MRACKFSCTVNVCFMQFPNFFLFFEAIESHRCRVIFPGSLCMGSTEQLSGQVRAPRGQGPALKAMGQPRQLACPEVALRIPPLPTVLHSIPIVCWCRSAQQQLAPGCAWRPTFLAARAGNVIDSGHSVRGLRPVAWLAGRRQVWPHRRRFKEVGSPLMALITILARRNLEMRAHGVLLLPLSPPSSVGCRRCLNPWPGFQVVLQGGQGAVPCSRWHRQPTWSAEPAGSVE